jgi:hypothetical protein
VLATMSACAPESHFSHLQGESPSRTKITNPFGGIYRVGLT